MNYSNIIIHNALPVSSFSHEFLMKDYISFIPAAPPAPVAPMPIPPYRPQTEGGGSIPPTISPGSEGASCEERSENILNRFETLIKDINSATEKGEFTIQNKDLFNARLNNIMSDIQIFVHDCFLDPTINILGILSKMSAAGNLAKQAMDHFLAGR